ncbi:MAG: hypothetical protein DMF69_07820 [Acidobacteria bacterium]|nr:MAG: hypothetical protein DMF69_07820 [Acidobacteriota bacterium]
MKRPNLIRCFLVAQIICLFTITIASGQTETLGLVRYKPPQDWVKTSKENVVVFSKQNEATGAYCFITLYGATPGSGDAQSDFNHEWSQLVVKPFKADPKPKTETESAAGWIGISGGAGIEVQGARAAAFLTVLSRGKTVISILGIANDETYLSQLVAFVSSIEPIDSLAKVNEPAAVSPTGAMHVAALVREFETNEVRANQTYIGKRMRVFGTVNTVELDRAGNIVLTFKSSVSTYMMAHCYLNSSQSAKVSRFNAGEEVTVDGTVKGLGDGFANSKGFLVLKDCTVPE